MHPCVDPFLLHLITASADARTPTAGFEAPGVGGGTPTWSAPGDDEVEDEAVDEDDELDEDEEETEDDDDDDGEEEEADEEEGEDDDEEDEDTGEPDKEA